MRRSGMSVFRSTRVTAVTSVLAAVLAGSALYAAGAATADNSVPRSDKEIPNLTTVESKIKAYYGDTVTNGEHYASADSSYAHQLAGIEAKAHTYLEHKVRGHHGAAKPAIVLDVDDTTLLTYNYELEVGFNYTPASSDTYIRTRTMKPVFGMPKLVNWAADHGITVFYVTGRPEAQRAPSAANLAAAGYKPAADATHFFLKNPANPPAYLPCGATCSTVGYKSGTRAHIESLGYDIVANFGDQYSDLSGGHADKGFKLPNPMYYLP
ncbi:MULTISPECIES: HAD family acid phosphatase [Streptomycetaceae]|uniref:Acid phosphatase (Class B) n=1 Tax=Streptantibioticus cattleyicolor (strain ATCC 35852 / DSM 46488 / JCM 4925 / NBRC 14057 / NRRL 8057) TaxID=1003195 RepID=F8K4C0_STREN|nr:MULTISPECIES: HAD family acid phosphatase [Streptomycetaceae]AEW93874.1 acid phosphatase (Class B) [Streptantibioticus cattleyicolor NRRL 8057 = DSM 46488]MYS58557.1 acid phosphatase [Streptomyces sp. SID5468]CCB74223.1 Predicted secreted acid phosphatase [Streptantibioticus cattleyicolor NRRL 8057 = DSM 46488]